MTTKRSFCATCRKEQSHAELLSEEEALTHRQNYVHHQVVLNLDAKEKKGDENV